MHKIQFFTTTILSYFPTNYDGSNSLSNPQIEYKYPKSFKNLTNMHGFMQRSPIIPLSPLNIIKCIITNAHSFQRYPRVSVSQTSLS